jgi:transposase
MSNSITRVGIDLAKNIFQVCAVDKNGKVLFNKTIKRSELKSFIANIPACEVILESCASSNYWYRVFSAYGHKVKLINPAYVRPYVKTNKNDAADAEALCEAAARPTMRFVQAKTPEQQDVQLLHRVRTRLVSRRTSLSNQLRGLLGEYGITINEGINNVRKQLPRILENAENDLSSAGRCVFAQLYDELVEIDKRVESLSKQLTQLSKSHSRCQQFTTVYGIGPMVSTALYAAMGDPKHYKNGREFAAFLGLVPRQYSTGGKPKLGGISKRGDTQTRTLLIQGAQAALSRMPKRDDDLSRWACKIKERRGHNIATVALANKLARICWAIAHNNTTFELKGA